MKFADLLKTIGLTNKLAPNATHISGQHAQSLDRTLLDIDRTYQAYNPYQQYQNPYVNQGTGSASSNVYYPPMYATNGPRDYGMKVGAPGTGHGHSAPVGGGHSGYGQNGHGSHQHYHQPVAGGGYDYEPSLSSRHQSKGPTDTAMTALTLLSFFFFINLLQSCLKEHMEAMNPTVMVMTTGVARNRYNKFKELYRSASKEISLDEDEQEENHHGDGHRRRDEDRREGNDDVDSRRDYDRQRFTYPNRTRSAATKTTKHRNQDHAYHDYYQKDSNEDDNGSEHHRDEIQTKLRNDYFKEGSAHYTRIY